jgi:RNA polymerase sigma-70 factor (ECF subfamily)
MLVDGVPGIVIAPRGRPQVLLRIGVGADNRIHTIDITGDADRFRRSVLALPHRPSERHHRPIRY